MTVVMTSEKRWSLYGLRISPKRWNKKFTKEASTETRFGEWFKWAMLIYSRKDGNIAIVILYADDMIAASNVTEKLYVISKKFLKWKSYQNRSIVLEWRFTAIEVNVKCLLHLKECNTLDTSEITRQVKNRNEKSKEKIDDSNDSTTTPYRAAIESL